MNKSSCADTDATRERIISAALKLFSRNGYLGATTKHIAREAGIAEVTLFRHFISKEKLLEEVLGRHSFVAVFTGLLPRIAGLPYEEGLLVLAECFLDAVALLRDWLRIVQSEAQRSPEKYHSWYRRQQGELLHGLAAYFREVQQQGSILAFDPETAALVFYGMLSSYCNSEELLFGGGGQSRETDGKVRGMIRIFTYGTLKGNGHDIYQSYVHNFRQNDGNGDVDHSLYGK